MDTDPHKELHDLERKVEKIEGFYTGIAWAVSIIGLVLAIIWRIK